MTREEHDNFFNDHQLEIGGKPPTQPTLDKNWAARLEYVRLTGHDMTIEELIGNYSGFFKRAMRGKIRERAKEIAREHDLSASEEIGLMDDCEDIIIEKGFL